MAYASSLFTGNAATWWHGEEATNVIIEGWGHFKYKVLEEFKPKNAKQSS